MKLGNDPLPKGRTFSPPPWKFVVLHYRRDGGSWARVRVCKSDMGIIARWISFKIRCPQILNNSYSTKSSYLTFYHVSAPNCDNMTEENECEAAVCRANADRNCWQTLWKMGSWVGPYLPKKTMLHFVNIIPCIFFKSLDIIIPSMVCIPLIILEYDNIYMMQMHKLSDSS